MSGKKNTNPQLIHFDDLKKKWNAIYPICTVEIHCFLDEIFEQQQLSLKSNQKRYFNSQYFNFNVFEVFCVNYIILFNIKRHNCLRKMKINKVSEWRTIIFLIFFLPTLSAERI